MPSPTKASVCLSFGAVVLDVQLAGNGCGDILAVAREHDRARSCRLETADGIERIRFKRVADEQMAGVCAIARNEEQRSYTFRILRGQSCDAFHEQAVSDEHVDAVNACGNALTCDFPDIRHARLVDYRIVSACFERFAYARCNRMEAECLSVRGQAQ